MFRDRVARQNHCKALMPRGSRQRIAIVLEACLAACHYPAQIWRRNSSISEKQKKAKPQPFDQDCSKFSSLQVRLIFSSS